MKKVLIEIIPVLVGILLALLINSWQQKLREEAYLKNSIQSIINENEENIKELNHAIKRQAILLDTLDKYMEEDRYSLADVLQKSQGVYTPDLKSTTWMFLIQDSKHTLVTYEFINMLAEIEKYEGLINRYNDKLGDIIFQPDFFDNPRMKMVCYALFSDFGQTEQSLIKHLEEFNEYARTEYF